VNCLDGRAFIKEVIGWSIRDPFKEFSGPPLSKSGHKKALRERRKDQSRNRLDVNTSTAGFRRRIDHFVMNLPQQAIEFLDAFRGMFQLQGDSLGGTWEIESIYDRMPRIHCYCFTKVLDEEAALKEIIEVRHLWTRIETGSLIFFFAFSMEESRGSSETETRSTRGRSAPSLRKKRGSDEDNVVHQL
jgi:hypothetical protein